MTEPADDPLQAFLEDSSERPAILVAMAHRVAAMASVVVFVAWLAARFSGAPEGWVSVAFAVFAVTLLLSLVFKFTSRYLERRLFERMVAAAKERS